MTLKESARPDPAAGRPEDRIKQFLELSHLSISLHNSNPRKEKLLHTVNWDQLIRVFSVWNDQKVKFIVTGYVAAAYHGLVRAAPFIEIISPEIIHSCPAFLQCNRCEKFEKYWQKANYLQVAGVELHVLGLQDLIDEFLFSEDHTREMDAITLIKSANSNRGL